MQVFNVDQVEVSPFAREFGRHVAVPIRVANSKH